jgi:hypothetical protein
MCDGHNFGLLTLLPAWWLRYAGGMDWTLGALLPHRSRPANHTLAEGAPLRLTRARSRVVICQHGCVWITAPGQRDDIFLHAGQRWVVPVDGLVLVEAQGSAAVTLDC